MKTILFQGDSITDAQRIKEDPDHMGSGYALMVAGQLGCEEVGKYRFINRGISGNRTIDVCNRIQNDIIDLSPDYMSLLIGINDLWHGIDYTFGLPLEDFEPNVDKIINETLAAHPKCKIMLIEPFVLKEYETIPRDSDPERWNKFNDGARARADLTKKIAEKHNIKFIPFQDKIEEASKETGVAYWSSDGVHLTPMGHRLLAEAWLEAFREIEE